MAKHDRRVLAAASVNVDAASQEKLAAVLAVEPNDLKLYQVHSFVTSPAWAKVLANWSFYSSANEHAAFTDLSVKLSKVTYLVNAAMSTAAAPIQALFAEAKPQIAEAYRVLLAGYTKVVYRALSSSRAPVTNPVLRLLTNIVAFSDGTLVDTFIDEFDLTLSVLPKLLVPAGATRATGATLDSLGRDHLSIRVNFIKWWLTLLAKAAPMTRKALLTTHHRIMANLWAHVADTDSLATLHLIVDFVRTSILAEPTFKKATKCKVLSENFMHKVPLIYNRLEAAPDTLALFSEVMTTVVSDPRSGLVYVRERPWLKTAAAGVLVAVNNRTFRIQNKLLYTLLTALKPWESTNQLVLVNATLTASVELVPPYMHWVVQSGGGYHDPSLTSWWVGHTLLYTHILGLPLPPLGGADDLDVRLVVENITLAPLSKGALTRCLQLPHFLVRQFACQLMVLQLRRLEALLPPVLAHRQELIELVLAALPDHLVVLHCYREASESDHKLLKLSLVTILGKAEQLVGTTAASAYSTSLLKYIDGEIRRTLEHPLSGIDVVLMDQFLAITSQLDDQGFKWWNRLATTNSFFTTLVKLSTTNLNESLVMKNAQLLCTLTEDTLLFNKRLIVNPVLALVRLVTARHQPVPAPVWHLLDETVARAVKSPYKYLDLSHQRHSDLSLFVVVLFEQLAFVDDDEAIWQWVADFMRCLVVIGEPSAAIEALMLTAGKELRYTTGTDASFMEFVASAPASQLANTKRFPMTKFELAGVLYRLKKLAAEGDLEAVTALMTLMGNFLVSALPDDAHLGAFIQTAEFFEGLIDNGATTAILGEILKQLPWRFDSHLELAQRVAKMIASLENPAAAGLAWILSDAQVEGLLEALPPSDASIPSLCRQLVERGSTTSYHLLQKLFNRRDTSEMLVSLIRANKIVFGDHLEQTVDQMLLQEAQHQYLKPLIEVHPHIVTHVIEKADSIVSEPLLCYLGYAMSSTVAAIDTKQVIRFMKRVLPMAVASLVWRHKVVILTTALLLDLIKVDDAAVAGTLDHVERHARDGFTTEFAQFAGEVVLRLAELPPGWKHWFHKSVLYITKKLAIATSISAMFNGFLEAMQQIAAALPHTGQSIWSVAPIAILNSQLEVILAHKLWCKHTTVLQYVNAVLLSGVTKNVVQYEKMMQIFINNDAIVLGGLPNGDHQARFELALVIANLFGMNEASNSTALVLDRLLSFYLGSIRAEDLVLKSVLVKIEAHQLFSWISQVHHWEISDELSPDEIDVVGGAERLVSVQKSGLAVALHKNFIRNCNENIHQWVAVPQFDHSALFAKRNHALVDQDYQQTIYDPEFLMMLIVSNEELFKFDAEAKPLADIKKLIEANLVQYIVNGLATLAAKFLQIIIQGLLKVTSDEHSTFKDKNIYRVLFANILNSLRQGDAVPGLVWALHGAMVPVLSNPGHFLYERTFRHVLSHPRIKGNHLPMLSSISMALSGELVPESDDAHFRQCGWLLDNLWFGIADARDVNMLRLSGAIEWMLNLLNSPFTSMRLRVLVFRVLYKVQTIDAGSDMLITRFGLLASLEQQHAMAAKVSGAPAKLNQLFSEQLAVNLDQLAVRLGVSAGSHKRIREWTQGDIGGAVKRAYKGPPTTVVAQ